MQHILRFTMPLAFSGLAACGATQAPASSTAGPQPQSTGTTATAETPASGGAGRLLTGPGAGTGNSPGCPDPHPASGQACTLPESSTCAYSAANGYEECRCSATHVWSCSEHPNISG